MTEAGDAGADQDFARTGVRYADILDHQRLVDFMQNGGLHRYFLFVFRSSTELFSPLPKGEVRSLSHLQQFANLGHPDAAFAKQMARDRALDGSFRQMERVARRYAMVDHHAR